MGDHGAVVTKKIIKESAVQGNEKLAEDIYYNLEKCYGRAQLKVADSPLQEFRRGEKRFPAEF